MLPAEAINGTPEEALFIPETPSGGLVAPSAAAFQESIALSASSVHVRSYHQDEALATPQPLGSNMLPKPPKGKLFVDTSKWGTYFHEKERREGITQYLQHATALAMQTKDYRTYVLRPMHTQCRPNAEQPGTACNATSCSLG